MFGDDLKADVAKCIQATSKTKKLDVYVSGPFRNEKTGKSNFVLVIADMSKVICLKSDFIRGYIASCLKNFNGTHIYVNHYRTFYNINICMKEFGINSDWRRSNNGKTITTVSFLISCETTNKKSGFVTVNATVDFIFKIMEKHERNPIGPMVIDYLSNRQNGLYKFILNTGKPDKMNNEDAGKKLTNDIHNHFKGGHTIHWNDRLNRFMAGYDIIRVLKDIGYSKWEDIQMKKMKKMLPGLQRGIQTPGLGNSTREILLIVEFKS